MSDLEDEDTYTLPPIICNNPRRKIEPEMIDPITIVPRSHSHRERPRRVRQLQEIGVLESDSIVEVIEPLPRYPIALTWSPDRLFFELYEEPITRKIWIWNRCPRTIYIQCSGLWDDKARLGASWVTGPRTRFFLAPGMRFMLFVKATPRLVAPISSAIIGLQITASHLRDNAKGIFAVPIAVTFLKYVEPHLGEE